MEALLYNNPIAPNRMDLLLNLLNFSKEDKILDIGCGTGELLLRAFEKFNCHGVGVDLEEPLIEKAKTKLAGFQKQLTLHASPAKALEFSPDSFTASFCLGATQAYGGPGKGYGETLEHLRKLTKPGGYLVIGEGYWKKAPADEYLKATGIGKEDYLTHFENVQYAENLGLKPVYVTTTTSAEWDHFESCFWFKAEERFQESPSDPKLLAQVEHWRNWRNSYLKWGHETLGFGIYVFLVS